MRCSPLPRSVIDRFRLRCARAERRLSAVDAGSSGSNSGSLPSGSMASSAWRANLLISPACSPIPSRSSIVSKSPSSCAEAIGSILVRPFARARAWAGLIRPAARALIVAVPLRDRMSDSLTRWTASAGCRSSLRPSQVAVETFPSSAANPRTSASRTARIPTAAHAASNSACERSINSSSASENVHTSSAVSIAAALRASCTALAIRASAGCVPTAADIPRSYLDSNKCSIIVKTSFVPTVTSF